MIEENAFSKINEAYKNEYKKAAYLTDVFLEWQHVNAKTIQNMPNIETYAAVSEAYIMSSKMLHEQVDIESVNSAVVERFEQDGRYDYIKLFEDTKDFMGYKMLNESNKYYQKYGNLLDDPYIAEAIVRDDDDDIIAPVNPGKPSVSTFDPDDDTETVATPVTNKSSVVRRDDEDDLTASDDTSDSDNLVTAFGSTDTGNTGTPTVIRDDEGEDEGEDEPKKAKTKAKTKAKAKQTLPDLDEDIVNGSDVDLNDVLDGLNKDTETLDDDIDMTDLGSSYEDRHNVFSRCSRNKISDNSIVAYVDRLYEKLKDRGQNTWAFTPIGLIDVSNVVNLDGVLAFKNIPRADLSLWDTTNVRSMKGLFYSSDFRNKSILDWNFKSIYAGVNNRKYAELDGFYAMFLCSSFPYDEINKNLTIPKGSHIVLHATDVDSYDNQSARNMADNDLSRFDANIDALNKNIDEDDTL